MSGSLKLSSEEMNELQKDFQRFADFAKNTDSEMVLTAIFTSDEGYPFAAVEYFLDDNFLARLGQPCSGENRKVYEHAHYYLDKFLQIGTVLKTDLEPGRYSDYCKLYKELKKKDSKIRVLYGVLSMPEIGEKKWSKAFLKDVKKYKKDILKMAEANDDKLTPEIIRSLL